MGRSDLEQLVSLLPRRGAEFETACLQISDWAALYEHAVRHRMHLIVFDAVLDSGFALPEAVAERFGRDLGRQLIWTAWIRTETSRVLDAFANAGIRTCPLKGPVFAERVMEKPELRPTTDIDVLVAPADVDAAGAILARLGYGREADSDNGPHPFEIRFVGGAGQLVELHFAAHEGFGGQLVADELLRRAEAYTTNDGARCFVLHAADEALYVAGHAAGHAFDQLSMLYDLRLAMERLTIEDQERLRNAADSCGYGFVLATGLRVLGAKLGERELEARLSRTSVRAALVIAVTGALDRMPYVSGMTGAIEAGVHAVLHERVGSGCRYYASRVVNAGRLRARRVGRRTGLYKAATN